MMNHDEDSTPPLRRESTPILPGQAGACPHERGYRASLYFSFIHLVPTLHVEASNPEIDTGGRAHLRPRPTTHDTTLPSTRRTASSTVSAAYDPRVAPRLFRHSFQNSAHGFLNPFRHNRRIQRRFLCSDGFGDRLAAFARIPITNTPTDTHDRTLPPMRHVRQRVVRLWHVVNNSTLLPHRNIAYRTPRLGNLIIAQQLSPLS
ncbi:hypothetical protein CSOJ01_08001 [Colletotrichum sojae]|uniref:Uncharacterized protein n=1 Tax=Colletotrichum sojae TaxID=2175907 RepID=A0A8H6MTL9_9PEZI|nr:hypothetical protein CSOJ01_08001 [Colletotrichum sojae]